MLLVPFEGSIQDRLCLMPLQTWAHWSPLHASLEYWPVELYASERIRQCSAAFPSQCWRQY